MSSWMEQVRSWLSVAPRRRRRAHTRLQAELLETRDTPSIVVSGTPPVWESVGPVAIASSQNVLLGGASQNIQSGGINTVAVDPFDPTHLAVATINGGVW